MRETILIKIISRTHGHNWYADKIGQEYKVETTSDEPDKYRVVGTSNYIWKHDAETIKTKQ